MKSEGKSYTLWTVSDFGEDSSPPGEEYRHDNAKEPSSETVVVLCLLKGEMTFHSTEETYNISAGDLITCRFGEDSSYEKTDLSQECTCLWVHLTGPGLAEHFNILRNQYRSVLNIGVHHPLIPGIHRLCSLTDPNDPADPLVMAAAVHRLVMSLFAYAEIGFNGKLTPANQAIHYLISAPFHPWNLKELAANCGCSREHLCREFAARYGQSPQQYLIQARGQRALYLLQHTALSISSIASQTGFPSVGSLDRQIKTMTGRTPQELRPMKCTDKPPGGKLQGLYDENKL